MKDMLIARLQGEIPLYNYIYQVDLSEMFKLYRFVEDVFRSSSVVSSSPVGFVYVASRRRYSVTHFYGMVTIDCLMPDAVPFYSLETFLNGFYVFKLNGGIIHLLNLTMETPIKHLCHPVLLDLPASAISHNIQVYLQDTINYSNNFYYPHGVVKIREESIKETRKYMASGQFRFELYHDIPTPSFGNTSSTLVPYRG